MGVKLINPNHCNLFGFGFWALTLFVKIFVCDKEFSYLSVIVCLVYNILCCLCCLGMVGNFQVFSKLRKVNLTFNFWFAFLIYSIQGFLITPKNSYIFLTDFWWFSLFSSKLHHSGNFDSEKEWPLSCS